MRLENKTVSSPAGKLRWFCPKLETLLVSSKGSSSRWEIDQSDELPH